MTNTTLVAWIPIKEQWRHIENLRTKLKTGGKGKERRSLERHEERQRKEKPGGIKVMKRQWKEKPREEHQRKEKCGEKRRKKEKGKTQRDDIRKSRERKKPGED
jgi:hypothetical protein